jgi:MFS family permease
MLYQGFINAATFLGAGIIQAVHHLDNKWAWRTPLMVMMSAPLVMILLVPLLPETPSKSIQCGAQNKTKLFRTEAPIPGWYITQGRYQEAREALGRIRGPTWPSSELDNEIADIKAMFELEHSLEGAATYSACFRKTDARRTRILLLFVLAQAFTGIPFISGFVYLPCMFKSQSQLDSNTRHVKLNSRYGTLFFSLSGIKEPFLATVITNVCGLAGSLAAFYLVKKLGRRALLLAGSSICGLCMLLFAIVGTAIPNTPAAANVLVVCVCIYLFMYGITWGPLPIAVINEIPSNGLRSKSISMATSLDWLASMLITCGSPYLINPQLLNMGVKLGFIFGGCLVVGTIWVYFELPETKDRTLEEIDEMFLNVGFLAGGELIALVFDVLLLLY